MALMKRPDMPDINKLAKPGKKREDGLSYLTAENAHRKEQGITPPAPPRRKLFGDIIQYKPLDRDSHSAGLYTAANTPSFEPENATLPWNRGTGIIRGAGAGTASGFLNLGGLAADTGARVIDAFKTGDYDTAQKTINRIEADLARGRTYDGERLTPRDIEHLRAQLAEAKAIVEAKKPEGTMESRNKTLTSLRDSLYQGADETADYGQQQTMRAKEGLGKLGQFGVDAAQAGLQMAGDAAMGGIGATLARSVGSSAQEARQAGADFNDQLGYGVSSGLLSAATEKIANVAAPFKAAFGAGVADKAIGKLMGRLSGSKLGKLALSALSEGGEEFIEDVFQPVLQRATYDPNARFNLDEALYDAAIGAVLGGAGSVGEIMATPKAPKAPKAETQPVRAPQQNVQTAAPGVDAPAENVAPAASQGTGVDVAENATTTRPVPDVPDIPAGDIEAVGPDNAVGTKSEGNGPSWKQKFLDESFFTNLANPRASEEMVDDEVRRFAEHAGESYEPGDTYGSFADYSWNIDRHKFGPYFELSVRNRITGESKHISGDRNQRSIASEISRAIYEDATNMLNEVRRPTPVATVSENATVASDTPVTGESSDARQNPSMGAADQGFDGGFAGFQAKADNFHPINEAAAERTAEERGRAPAEVPKYNPNTGEYIGKGISSMLNSPITSNEAAEALEGALVDGKFTHVTIPDSALTSKAKEKVNASNYKTVASNFIAMVDGGKRISAQDSTDALVAFNEAVTQNDQTTIVELAEAMDNVKNDTARLFRSFGFVNRLTPAGNLLRLSQVVKRINGKAGSKLAEQMEISKALQEAVDQAKQQRVEVMEILQTMIDSYAEQYGQKPKTLEDILAGKSTASEIDAKISEGKSSWIAELAKALAQNAESTVKPRTDRERTVYELISSDLNKFMHQYLSQKKQTTKKRTAGDTLRDFFANRQEYARAWNMAKDNLRQQYKNNPDMLGRLEEFLGGTITYNSTGNDAVMMRAMVDAALSQDVRAKEKLIRGKYDASNLAAEIASDVIRESGATDPADIDLIEQAAKRWVDAETTKAADARRDATANSSNPADVGEEAQSYFRGDIRKAMHDIGLKMQEIILQNAGSKESAGRQIAGLLSNRYHISPDGATRIASDIMANYDAMVNEAAEAKLEAMFKDRGDRVKKSVQQKFTELANLGAFTNDQYNTQAAQKIFGYDGIKVDAKDVEAYLNAKTEEDRETAWNNLLDKVAEQLPTSGVEKWNAWRYTSMLGNLRTHGRNILGNTGVQPMRVVKDRLAASMEAGVNKIADTKWGKQHNVGKIERTKAFVYDPKLWKFAWADSNDKTSQDLMAGGKIDDIPGELDQRKRIFNFKPAEWARKKVSSSLEAEDRFFKKITYTDALSGYLSSHGVTAEMANNGQIPQELLQKARAYAANEARVATFQDENAFSDMVAAIGSEIDRVGGDRVWAKVVRGGAKLMVEGNLPFKRTPGNVFVTGMRYSPLGYVDALVKAYEAKTGRGATANDVIDSIATATTGSGMFALGAMLLLKGVLSASHDDDDERAFDDLQGKQEYALTVNGKTYTMDWAAPEAIPLFMGAEFAKTFAEEGFGVKAILNAIKASANPMLEMSMLSSLNDTIESVKWAEGEPLPALVEQTMVSYLTQAVPTMLGQLERSTQEDSMMTYVDPGSPLPRDLQKILGKASARIPGWDFQQIPYIDGWGRTKTNKSKPGRLFDNMVSPSFVAEVNETPVDKEIARLYKTTGELLNPGQYKKNVSTDSGVKTFSANEYAEYAKHLGRTRYDLLEKSMKTGWYKKMNDREKASFVSDVYDYATQLANERAGGKDADAWVHNAQNAKKNLGISTGEFIILKQKYGGAVTNKGSYEKLKKAHEIGLTPEEYFQAKREADVDGNGRVNVDETEAYVRGKKNPGALWDLINTTGAKNRYK